MELLNKLDSSGKIQNQKSPVSSSYCVSPYHKHFKSQIETGVWAYVNLALQKNYLTINSCEGHLLEDSLEITFVFYDDDKIERFLKYFQRFPLHIDVTDKFINEFNGKNFYYVNEQEQTNILNHMFMMNNPSYKFVTVFANKEWDKKQNYFLYCCKKLAIDAYSKHVLYNILHRLPNYESL